MSNTEVSTAALSLVGRINACHRECVKAGNETLKYAVECGELLTEVKAVLKADGSTTFGIWVGQFLDFSERSADVYCRLHKDLGKLPKAQRAALFDEAESIRGLQKLISQAVPKATPAPAPAAPPTPAAAQSDAPVPIESAGLDDAPMDADPLEPAAQVEPPQDLGRCPNCAGTKWTEDEDGYFCAKCKHTHGEATGGADEDRISMQKAKSRKTCEALMRAFDDLNYLHPTHEHREAIQVCKRLLTIIKQRC
jgi:hypothetical protein